MTSSTPSSLSRYRPALLVFTGAAAAFAAWSLYSSVQASAPSSDLHRSNALRRGNRRARARSSATTTSIRRLQNETIVLGSFEFFGNDIALDARHVMSADNLRQIAHESEPTASPEMVDNRIAELYDTFYDRLLGYAFPDRALSDGEAQAVTRMITEQIAENPAGLLQALQRHRSRFTDEEIDALLATEDGTESVAPTDLDWTDDDNMMEAGMDPAGASLQRTLYHIAEDRARHEGIIHRGITCNACETKPIRGIRWRCVNCSDFDLCSDCEAANIHNRTHLFYKIRVPAPYMSLPRQEPVYPGRPHVMPSSINALHKRRLVEQTRKEAEEIEALWDQFTCLAATEWMSDPDQVGFAIDRRAFNHAFIPRYSSFTSVPNLVYDRIFAYFDTDNNGLIGFEEFIKGLDGLHSTDTCVKLRIAFNGYDIDGDGYISRKDVLRIFRAHFAIEREATRNYLNDSEEELSLRGLLETIRSSKPLGSAFTQQSRFSALPNRELPANKGQNGYYPEPIVDDIPDTMDRAAVIGWAHRYGHGMEGPGIDFLDAQDEAIRDRWARRQYYTDEEEGLTRPACADDNQFAELETQPDGEGERSSSSENERRRESRSSSRVRFEDDVNGDTRSNASSRPVGERWGGYDIPIPENEKELGKDVSYQIIQQAFNELLDPLFKKKESLAMDAFATRLERRLNPSPITSLYRNHYTTERAFNKTVLRIGTSRYAAYVVHIFNNNNLLLLFKRTEGVTRDDLVAEIKMHFALAEQEIAQRLKIQNDDRQYPEDELWNVKLWRTQMLDEFTDTIVTLLQGMLAVVKETYQDPTMPQFRPNSLVKTKLSELESKPTEDGEASSSVNQSEFGPFFITVGECVSPLPTSPQFEDVTPTSSPSILHLSVNAQFEALVFKHVPHQIVDVGEALRHEALDNKSSPLHFPYLAYLQHVDHAITEHNNGGMLDFEEFVACVEKGGLRFLESWMDFVSF